MSTPPPRPDTALDRGGPRRGGRQRGGVQRGASGAGGSGSGAQRPPVEVRRSRRRRRTVAAYRDGDRVVVLLPARMSRAEEQQWVTTMLDRLERQEQRRKPSDQTLQRRARELSRRYLGGRAKPKTVRWVDNQRSRWGSCTPADRSIRLSSRLQGMPPWVIDYVLMHELAHLIEAGHDERFWSLVESYPRTERARGYLEGVAAAAGLEVGDDLGEPHDDLDDPPHAVEAAADVVDDSGRQ